MVECCLDSDMMLRPSRKDNRVEVAIENEEYVITQLQHLCEKARRVNVRNTCDTTRAAVAFNALVGAMKHETTVCHPIRDVFGVSGSMPAVINHLSSRSDGGYGSVD